MKEVLRWSVQLHRSFSTLTSSLELDNARGHIYKVMELTVFLSKAKRTGHQWSVRLGFREVVCLRETEDCHASAASRNLNQ